MRSTAMLAGCLLFGCFSSEAEGGHDAASPGDAGPMRVMPGPRCDGGLPDARVCDAPRPTPTPQCDGGCPSEGCTPGSRRCVPETRARLVCPPDGTQWAPDPCPDDLHCLEVDDQVACVPEHCPRERLACTDDGSERLVCVLQEGPILTLDDCGARGEECRSQACRKRLCEPGARRCVSAKVGGMCSDDGWTMTMDVQCRGDLVCDPETVTCEPPQPCTPNQPLCSGTTAVVCNAFGTRPLSTGRTDCDGMGMGCRDGHCDERVCQQGARRCDQEVPLVCDPGAVSWTAEPRCDGERFCSDGRCEPWVCAPGEPVCDAGHATVCDERGSGPVAGGTDCATDGRVCYQGACRERICTPGAASQCVDGDIQRCVAPGAAFELVQQCLTGKACRAGASPSQAPACVDQLCEPGQPACDGHLLRTCDSTGLGFEAGGSDCWLRGQECHPESGTCQPRVCIPGARRCEGNGIVTCAADGLTESTAGDCTLDRFCTDDACRLGSCSPGAPFCLGTYVAECGPDGASLAAAPSDCAATPGQTCVDGACVPTVCTPDAVACIGDDLRRCNRHGTGFDLLVTCPVTCDVVGGMAQCTN